MPFYLVKQSGIVALVHGVRFRDRALRVAGVARLELRLEPLDVVQTRDPICVSAGRDVLLV